MKQTFLKTLKKNFFLNILFKICFDDLVRFMELKKKEDLVKVRRTGLRLERTPWICLKQLSFIFLGCNGDTFPLKCIMYKEITQRNH